MFLILFALSPCISQGDELIELRGTLRTGKLTKRGDSQAASATLTHFRRGNVSDLRVGALTSSNSTKTSPKPTPQCLTLRPKKDGFGSQYAALISVYGYAVRTNSTFCTRHWSRMAHGLDPTTMFNFVGGHRYYFTREESCPCRTRGAPKKNMHGDMAGHYRSHPEVAMMVREYYNAGRNPELTWFPGKIGEPLQSDQSTQTEQNTTQATPFYLAIHVRRGDAADKNETVHAMNRTGNHSTVSEPTPSPPARELFRRLDLCLLTGSGHAGPGRSTVDAVHGRRGLHNLCDQSARGLAGWAHRRVPCRWYVSGAFVQRCGSQGAAGSCSVHKRRGRTRCSWS